MELERELRELERKSEGARMKKKEPEWGIIPLKIVLIEITILPSHILRNIT